MNTIPDKGTNEKTNTESNTFSYRLIYKFNRSLVTWAHWVLLDIFTNNKFKIFDIFQLKNIFSIDKGRKLNAHKTFRRRPGSFFKVLCTFNLRAVATGFTFGEISLAKNKIVKKCVSFSSCTRLRFNTNPLTIS